jgi:hypothetical protein
MEQQATELKQANPLQVIKPDHSVSEHQPLSESDEEESKQDKLELDFQKLALSFGSKQKKRPKPKDEANISNQLDQST